MQQTFIVLISVLLIQACTVRKDRADETTELEATPAPAETPQDKAETAELKIELESAKELYEIMVKAEEEASQKPRNERVTVQSLRGIITCKLQGGFNNCFFHTRTKERGKLVGPYSIPKSMTSSLVSFIKDKTNASDEGAIKADIICDYVGRKSPPYGMEALDCSAINPRQINETFFLGKTADKLADVLKGAQSYGKSVTILNGSILCQWIEGSNRTPCVVRPIMNGVLQDKFIEVPTRQSNQISRDLLESLRDSYYYGNISNEEFEMPTEIIGTIVCNVDNKDFESFGKRDIVCKVNI